MSKICIYIVIILMASTIFNSNIFVSSGGELRSEDPSTNENDKIASPSTIDPDLIDNEISAKARFKGFNQGDGNNFFTVNNGQIDTTEVKFSIQGQGIWFTSTGVVFELREPVDEHPEKFNKFKMPDFDDSKESIDVQYRSEVVTFEFLNMNDVSPMGIDELLHKSNFFYGNDSSKWSTNVPNYQAILYKNIYDNIDLRYYFNEDGLKYDFIVNPGGDPNDIGIKVEGAEELTLGTSTPDSPTSGRLDSLTPRHFDTLTVKTGLADIVDSNLFAYQENNDENILVTAGFKLIDSHCYGFEILGDYNKYIPMIIDPLIYSTYIGSSWADEAAIDIDIDDSDNIYVAGWTESWDFPVTIGSINTTHQGKEDIFVLKLGSDGNSLKYSTFLGGTDHEELVGINVDDKGNAVITGNTISDNFPTTPGANDTSFNGGIDLGTSWGGDAFISKINPNGNNLVFSTYIGGQLFDICSDLTVDNNGNAFITGHTTSLDFPTTPGVYKSTRSNSPDDVFVTALSNDGSKILHSTYINGSESDAGKSITLDYDNNICIFGITRSPDFPTTIGAWDEEFPKDKNDYDAFILKLNGDISSLLFSTGSGAPVGALYATSIMADTQNNVYIAAYSGNSFFPTTPDAFDITWNGEVDVIISKFDANLSSLEYSTFIGGMNDDIVWCASIDSENNIYFVGETDSPDFPITEFAYDKTHNGGKDVFFAKFNLTNSELVYSTFIGSSQDEIAYSLSLHDKNNISIVGQAKAGFPTTAGSYDPTYNNGGSDAFVSKFQMISSSNILDLNVSESIVFRPNTISLFSNATDYEDPENELTPHFEYMCPNKLLWQSTFINSPKYNNNRWQVQFLIPIDANIGYYNFRVRYNDTDGILTDWFYLNGSLFVMNNLPVIDYLNLSKTIAVISEEIEFKMMGSDVEDTAKQLTFVPEIKSSTETFWNLLEYDSIIFNGPEYTYNFSINPDMPYGFYDFRVKVNDTDGDYSDWVYLNKSLLLMPAPPEMLSIKLTKHEINRTEYFEVFVNCSDIDSPNDELFVELQYRSELEQNWNNLSVDEINDQWESYVQSKKTWKLGNYSFRAKATDMEDNTSPWLYLNDSLKLLNNVPELLNIENIPEQMDRGNSISISLNAKDKENPEDSLVIEFTYRLPSRSDWLSDYLSVPNYSESSWQYQFSLPNYAPTGAYSFRARVQDLDNDWSSYFYVNDSMRVMNFAPEVIAFDQSPNEVFRTKTITITAEGSDLETLPKFLNCSIYFLESNSHTWQGLTAQYNESSGKWISELITTKSSVLGNYSFKVLFIDSDGLASKPWYYNQTVRVKNNLPEISSELDDIEVGKNQKLLKLTDFGYDVETSKSNLRWTIDQSTVNIKLFHIETENIGDQELVIYPVKSKEGKDDITLILIDADNGRTIKRDITIIVNSKSGGGIDSPDEDGPVLKLISGDSYWLYIIILIIIITLFVLFIFYRRKKQKEKEARGKEEELVQELEETRTESEDEVLLPDTESSLPEVEAQQPVSVPVIEKPAEPAFVPMPVPVEQPQLSSGIDITSPETIDPPETTQLATEPEIRNTQPEDLQTDMIPEETETKKELSSENESETQDLDS